MINIFAIITQKYTEMCKLVLNFQLTPSNLTDVDSAVQF